MTDILQDRERLAECFRLLDRVRGLSSTDVLDARAYLSMFGLDPETAKAVQIAWTQTLSASIRRKRGPSGTSQANRWTSRDLSEFA